MGERDVDDWGGEMGDGQAMCELIERLAVAYEQAQDQMTQLRRDLARLQRAVAARATSHGGHGPRPPRRKRADA